MFFAFTWEACVRGSDAEAKQGRWPGRPLGTGELLLWPTVAYTYFFLVMRLTGFDHAVARFFAAPGQQGFPLRDAYLTGYLLHDVTQMAMKIVMIVLLLAWVGTWMHTVLARWRRPLGYLVLTALLGVGLVNLGKQVSNLDCPWDLQSFGGRRVFYDLFDSRPAAAPVGHCFPGGHSSSGFALFGLFFLLRRRRPSAAALGLLLPLFLGVGLAVVQWARGAHFPSHDLTTAYLCWLTACAGDYWILGRYGTDPVAVD